MQKSFLSPCLRCEYLQRKSTNFIEDDTKHWFCSYADIPAIFKNTIKDIHIHEEKGEIICYSNDQTPIKVCNLYGRSALSKQEPIKATKWKATVTSSEEIEEDLEDTDNDFNDEETEEDKYYREKAFFEESLTTKQLEQMKKFYTDNDEL